MTRFYLILFKAVLLSMLVTANGYAQSTSRNQQMSTNTWRTDCFGRFQIALPPEAKIGADYHIWGNNIERSWKSVASIKQEFDKREQELKAQRHNSGGQMFVDRAFYGNGSESMLSWKRPTSSILMGRISYLVSSDGKVIYKYESEVAPEKRSSSDDYMKYLAKNIRSRQPYAIPTEPGFCLNGGYIAGNDFRSERFDLGITLPDHPGAHISFYSSTGAEEDTLLERTGGFFRNHVMGPVAGLHTLRKGKRNLGPIPGEEYLIVSNAKGQRLYAFKWESQGKNNSLAEPNLSLELNVMGEDDDDTPPPKAFKSDEEALQLWDALLNSIRLRPGAV